MNRGIALVESYTLLENQKVSEGNMEIAIALGWAVELVILSICKKMLSFYFCILFCMLQTIHLFLVIISYYICIEQS